MTNKSWIDRIFDQNTDHQAMENRDAVNAHPATAVGYVADQASQLANSTTVQHAIDTLDKTTSSIPTDHSQLSGLDDADVHPAGSISYTPGQGVTIPAENVRDALDRLGQLAATITRDHAVLDNRNAIAQHHASAIEYYPPQNTITATNASEALDELAIRSIGIKTDHNQLNGRDLSMCHPASAISVMNVPGIGNVTDLQSAMELISQKFITSVSVIKSAEVVGPGMQVLFTATYSNAFMIIFERSNNNGVSWSSATLTAPSNPASWTYSFEVGDWLVRVRAVGAFATAYSNVLAFNVG